MADITKEDIKKIILEIITNSEGLRGVELAMKVLNRTLPVQFHGSLFREALDELVFEESIIAVDYMLPGDRSKSVFYPKGTRVGVGKP